MKHLNSIRQKGENNSQFGKSWYYNPVTNQSKPFLPNEVPEGWVKGRKCVKQKQIEAKKANVERYNQNPKLCQYCNAPISYERRFTKTCCNEHGTLLNRKHNHETQMIRHTSGGRRQGSGRGKKGWYHGIWCDSSWELAWVIYQLEHDVWFERYKGFFEYEYEGQIHKYYPDFKLQDGSFVEIKGYSSKQWKSKLDSFPKDKVIQVLYKSDMKPILDYVTSKYGKDFIRLYE